MSVVMNDLQGENGLTLMVMISMSDRNPRTMDAALGLGYYTHHTRDVAQLRRVGGPPLNWC